MSINEMEELQAQLRRLIHNLDQDGGKDDRAGKIRDAEAVLFAEIREAREEMGL